MRAVFAVFLSLFSALVAANPLSDIVVFGDSLSDNGNLYDYMQIPTSPPYFSGRFSDGEVWPEKLASYYPKTPLYDYAFGGAMVGNNDEEDDTVLTLKNEINGYFHKHNDVASPDSLYMIWIGANNYLGIPEDVSKTVTEVNQGIHDSAQRLVDKGAKHILLINMPDLAKLPFAIEFNLQAPLHEYTEKHNALLVKNIADLQSEYPQVQWLYFDVNAMFQEELSEPERYGFSDITHSCYKPKNSIRSLKRPKSVLQMASVKEEPTPECGGYLFFDAVHPTTAAHKLMAEKLKHFLQDAGVEFIG